MPPKGFKSVSFPEKLGDAIQVMIKKYPELGYRSMSHFIDVAVRNTKEYDVILKRLVPAE